MKSVDLFVTRNTDCTCGSSDSWSIQLSHNKQTRSKEPCSNGDFFRLVYKDAQSERICAAGFEQMTGMKIKPGSQHKITITLHDEEID